MTTFTHIITLAILASTLSAAEVRVSKAPNIMVILVDDMGYSDLGCYGGEIKTPILDGLAANGLRYAQFYNAARCWPTRAALLSGYYPQQINRDTFSTPSKPGPRPRWAPLLPHYLKSAGYRSYHSGKWHMDGMPTGSGFDRSVRIDDHDRYFSAPGIAQVYREYPDAKHESGVYATTAIADHAIGVLRDHQKNYPGASFFSLVAFSAPHFPLQALPGDIERVGDRYKAGWDAVRQQRWERLQALGLVQQGELSQVEYDQGPPYDFPEQIRMLGPGEVTRPVPWTALTERQKEFQQNKMTIHAAMVERVDMEVGRILTQVKAMNAFEDTVIFFLSDNGASAEIMVRGDGHDPDAAPGSAASYLCLGPGWATVCNTPFRKHKTWTHEGGSCTPLIVHWPATITAAGEIRETPGHVIDLVPTILDLAGVPAADRKVPFPGRSLVPSFSQETREKRQLWWSHEGNHAVRQGALKLVKTRTGDWELYNLDEDRAETINLAAQFPEKVMALKKLWEAQAAQIREAGN